MATGKLIATRRVLVGTAIALFVAVVPASGQVLVAIEAQAPSPPTPRLEFERALFWAAAGADTTTTVIGTARGYQESNPFVSGPVSAVVVTMGSAILVDWAARRLRDTGHPSAARLIWWFGVGTRGTFATLNARQLAREE